LIKDFRHKGVAELFTTGASRRIRQDLATRILQRLDVMHRATRKDDLNGRGFSFHMLHGKPQRYSIHVNGPWCLTFEWIDGHIWRVDLEQYH
jgi:toxin HigB-1